LNLAAGSLIEKTSGLNLAAGSQKIRNRGYRQARLGNPNPRTTENKKSGMYQPSRRALAPGSLIKKNIGFEPSRRALAPGSR